MIEKITELEKNRMWAGETAREILCNKINELVDAVNEIMTWRFETDDEPAENAQDPTKTSYNVVTGEMEEPEDQSVGALIKSMGITFEEFLTRACDILSKK